MSTCKHRSESLSTTGNSRKKLTKVTLKVISANPQAGRILCGLDEAEEMYVI